MPTLVQVGLMQFALNAFVFLSTLTLQMEKLSAKSLV